MNARRPLPDHARPISVVLGVLGGIASGKSEVARLLAGPEGVVLSADLLAREAIDSPAVRAALVGRYGAAVVRADGDLDRELLAERVFRDPGERKWLEGWIHPFVRDKIRCGIEEARSRGVARIVLDVPLLLENDAEHGLARACDALVFVEASPEVRERRAREKRGWKPGEVARREQAQWPLEAKRRHARWILSNDGSHEALEAAVRRVLAELGTP